MHSCCLRKRWWLYSGVEVAGDFDRRMERYTNTGLLKMLSSRAAKGMIFAALSTSVDTAEALSYHQILLPHDAPPLEMECDSPTHHRRNVGR